MAGKKAEIRSTFSGKPKKSLRIEENPIKVTCKLCGRSFSGYRSQKPLCIECFSAGGDYVDRILHT